MKLEGTMELSKDENLSEQCIEGLHKLVFLRTEERKSYTQRVDLFFCEKCLKYFDKIVWQGRGSW